MLFLYIFQLGETVRNQRKAPRLLEPLQLLLSPLQREHFLRQGWRGKHRNRDGILLFNGWPAHRARGRRRGAASLQAVDLLRRVQAALRRAQVSSLVLSRAALFFFTAGLAFC